MDDDSSDNSGSEDFDVDSLAQKAVDVAKQKAKSKDHEVPPSLDIGVDRSQLYFSLGDSNDSFYTANPAGRNVLQFQKPPDIQEAARVVDENIEDSVESMNEVRGTPASRLDDSKEKRKQLRQKKAERLDKWFGLSKRQVTPEMEKELQAIKLRAYFDPKRFYKSNDSKALPTHFTVGTMVGGGLASAGEHARPETKAGSGRSFLSELLKDDKAQDWTRTRLSAFQAKGQAAGKNNKKAKKKGPSWKASKGSNFKKRKRG